MNMNKSCTLGTLAGASTAFNKSNPVLGRAAERVFWATAVLFSKIASFCHQVVVHLFSNSSCDIYSLAVLSTATHRNVCAHPYISPGVKMSNAVKYSRSHVDNLVTVCQMCLACQLCSGVCVCTSHTSSNHW